MLSYVIIYRENTTNFYNIGVVARIDIFIKYQ